MTPLQRISTYSLISLLLTVVMSFSINSEAIYTGSGLKSLAAAQTVSVIIKATSTLHDWEMKSNKGRVEVSVGLGDNAKLLGLSALAFCMDSYSHLLPGLFLPN